MKKYVNKELNILIYYNEISDELNINNELIRGKCYLIILKCFINLIKKHFNEKLFIKKKPFVRTISNILSTFIFSQYINIKNIEDPFIPKLVSLDLLKNIILDFIKNDKTFENYDKFFFEFEKIYNNNYNKFIKIIKTCKNKYYKIIKKPYNINNINFHKFIINYNTNSLHFNNLINHIIIPVSKYNLLKIKFIGNINKFDYYIWSILFRYQILGSNNHQLAILPSIINNLHNDFNMNMESFGSAINCQSKFFGSLYPDLEQNFGSFGNFFNIKFVEGFYNFNPPFQEDIIQKGINNIIFFLKESNKKLGFFITIPIWDKKGKKNFNINDEYNDFKIIYTIQKSKFLKAKIAISKDNFSYIDHNFKLIKNTTIQNTYVFILANYNNNFQDIISKYDFFNFNI